MNDLISTFKFSPVWSFAQRCQRDIVVGLIVGLTLLSASLAGGVIVATPLGQDHLAFGVAASIAGAMFGGACAALFSTSSFIMWGPIPTIALVQASLLSILVADPTLARDPVVAETALFLCIGIAGLVQIVVGLAGLASIARYVPHPVVAGFINGVSGSIFVSQIKLFFPLAQWKAGDSTFFAHPTMFAFVVGLVIFIFWIGARNKKVPAPVAGLIVGVIGYHMARLAWPAVDLGTTLGRLPINLPPVAPIVNLAERETQQMLIAAAPHIMSIALAIVLVGTLQSLLAFRMAGNLSKVPIAPDRGLVALGLADVVCAATGGLAISVGAPMSAAAFRNGGRTRIVGLAASVGLFFLAILIPESLSNIPLAALVALLIVVSISSFDRWSLRLLLDIMRGNVKHDGLRPYYDLFVVFIVTVVIVAVSVVPGILAGVAATCLTFVIDMSRPIIRRRLSGANVRSKRVRTSGEAIVLREQGKQCVVLQLNGVLFFGNAEMLAQEVSGLSGTRIIVLDCRGVTNIDVTGANIIRDIVENGQRAGKITLFCNVPNTLRKTIASNVGTGGDKLIFENLDFALEWVEDKLLNENDPALSKPGSLQLHEHDLLRGLDESEREIFKGLLEAREYPPGETLAVEGEPGDRMWLIVRGAVDIRLKVDGSPVSRRIASLGTGTTVGEMALIEGTPRSATVVAAGDLTCWELEKKNYETLMGQYPQIATKLLTNLIREMARRIRNTSEQLREIES